MSVQAYWADRRLMRYYRTEQPWAPALVDAVLVSQPATILDFGCNMGRNLRAIRARAPEATLIGIDVNRKAVAWGRAHWGLDLRAGNEAALEPDMADVAFTVSVIDHIADPGPALEALSMAAPRLVLVEPWTGEDGAAMPISPAPYTWSWDIPTRLREMGMSVRVKRFPLGADPFSQTYRMYVARR